MFIGVSHAETLRRVREFQLNPIRVVNGVSRVPMLRRIAIYVGFRGGNPDGSWLPTTIVNNTPIRLRGRRLSSQIRIGRVVAGEDARLQFLYEADATIVSDRLYEAFTPILV